LSAGGWGVLDWGGAIGTGELTLAIDIGNILFVASDLARVATNDP
jgi:hypothetical protein